MLRNERFLKQADSDVEIKEDSKRVIRVQRYKTLRIVNVHECQKHFPDLRMSQDHSAPWRINVANTDLSKMVCRSVRSEKSKFQTRNSTHYFKNKSIFGWEFTKKWGKYGVCIFSQLSNTLINHVLCKHLPECQVRWISHIWASSSSNTIRFFFVYVAEFLWCETYSFQANL